MTRYQYRAARDDGEHVTGVISAANDAGAVAALTERGLLALQVHFREDQTDTKPLSADESSRLLGGLAAFIEAGLPADRALNTASETSSRKAKEFMEEAAQLVREGSSVSAAIESTRGFPTHVTGMLRVGEAQGALGASLRRASAELGAEAETRARLKAALTYPAFLLAAGTVSVVLIVGYVIPRFASLLTDLGQALPRATRLLLAASVSVRSHGLMIAAAFGVALALVASLWRRPEFRARLHEAILGWPVLGDLRASMATARICRTLAALLETGVPMLAALDLAKSACADLAIAARLTAARADVSEGSGLEPALRRHGVLTPSALQLARFGEETGRLKEFLAQAADLEAASAQRSARTIVTLVEPVLILGFGAVVAFVAAALLQAVYSVRPGGV